MRRYLIEFEVRVSFNLKNCLKSIYFKNLSIRYCNFNFFIKLEVRKPAVTEMLKWWPNSGDRRNIFDKLLIQGLYDTDIMFHLSRFDGE